MALPSGFVNLATAYNATPQSFVSIIGVVVDLMPPSLTRQGQYMFTFKLQDIPLYSSGYSSQGLSVRFFKPDLQSLPDVRNVGDIVLVREAKCQPFAQQAMLISNYQTAVLVFPATAIPDPSFEISFQGIHRLDCRGTPLHRQSLSLLEQKYVIALHQETKPIIQTLGARPEITNPAFDVPTRGFEHPLPPTGPAAMKRPGSSLPPPLPKKTKVGGPGPKFRLIQDARHAEFADLIGQVVKKFARFDMCDLYITDYTENRELFHYSPPEEHTGGERDGDAFGYSGVSKHSWPGPYGHLVLKVNLKNPHASYVDREVNVGDFVLLKNVKMKTMPDGRMLEGDLWPDHLNPGRVNIQRLRDPGPPEVDAIRERKDKYWKDRESRQKPPSTTKLTKTEKKRRKRQEKERLAERASKPTAEPPEKAVDAPTESRQRTDINQHVRCSHAEVPILSIADIKDPENIHHTNITPQGNSYTLPFANVKTRAMVRCIDFVPKELADFAQPASLYASDEEISQYTMHGPSENFSQRFEWNFSLLLQDAQKPPQDSSSCVERSDSMWVSLGHHEAQHLFGNALPDPCDLRQNPRLLAQLRERLYILWGNLAELKQDADAGKLSNLPFECCIAEFGVPTKQDKSVHGPDGDHVQVNNNNARDGFEKWGWKRCYRMFGVTIL